MVVETLKNETGSTVLTLDQSQQLVMREFGDIQRQKMKSWMIARMLHRMYQMKDENNMLREFW